MKNKTDPGLFPNSLKRGLAHMPILFLKIRGQTMPFIIFKKKNIDNIRHLLFQILVTIWSSKS